MSYSKLFSIFFLFFFFTTFTSSLNDNPKCSDKQSEALLLFKRNLSSINDPTWILLCPDYYPIMMSWNTSTDCCNWKGVTCDDSTGDVIGLDLTCGLLQGTIHPNSSLFNLPHLQKLNLAYNYFYPSQIPHEIGMLSNSLTHLNLSSCSFSGQVPPDITLLHKLVSLDLSFNDYLNFRMRPHVFNNLLQNFTNLEQLSLEEVNISSVLPDRLNISSSLKLLNLGHTGLQGKLPHSILNLHSLETLELGGNSFIGDIPSEILVNLTHFTNLDLSNNILNGTLPSWLFNSPTLEYLDLRDNMFSGKVPFESFDLPSLKYLYLQNNNQLAGHTDMQIFRKLTNLTALDLSYNNFSGEWELDTLLSSLTKLEYLDLSYSGLSVTTNNTNHYVNPGFISLRLASCKLKLFPNSIRAMKQLTLLDLSSNEIHGQIPHWAGEIGGNELYYLNLSHNFITSLPQFQWYGLLYLYLQSNLIEGPFPTSICNMSNLTCLYMSNNHFGGLIPQCLVNITSSIKRMDLGTNQLQGPFPPSICSKSNLRYLDISNNCFDGLIPQCFGNITSSPRMINMGNNRFQGTIPNVYGDCQSLEGLILKGNQLEGELPRSLSKCGHLSVIDLGNNHLNGTFPGWLGELSKLKVLILKSNKFHGHIQPSSAVTFPFSNLHVPHLSHNRFVGQLPAKYFQNFNSMKNVVQNSIKPEYLSTGADINSFYSFVVAMKGVDQDIPRLFVNLTIIDLSNNYFDREMPNIIGNLRFLKVLNLSHNHLNSRIPYSLGNLSEIESLDLSWNQLTGKILQSLAGIKRLEVLRLSHNRLVGRIPDGTQFKTFDKNSFEGNVGLWGYPLPKKCNEYTNKPQLEARKDQEEESGFTWEVVTLGYGCGTLLGLVMGYFMLSTRKVKWFNAFADEAQSLVLKKKRRHIYIGK